MATMIKAVIEKFGENEPITKSFINEVNNFDGNEIDEILIKVWFETIMN